MTKRDIQKRTSERLALIKPLLNSGLTHREIAKKAGLTPGVVAGLIHRHDIRRQKRRA